MKIKYDEVKHLYEKYTIEQLERFYNHFKMYPGKYAVYQTKILKKALDIHKNLQ